MTSKLPVSDQITGNRKKASGQEKKEMNKITGETIEIMIVILVLLALTIYMMTDSRMNPKEEPAAVAWCADDFMKTIK